MHGSSFVCGYVVCVCVSSRGCRSIGAILVFRCRRIVDVVVVVVSLSLSLSFFCSLLVLHACSSCFLLFAVGASSVVGRRLSSKLTLHSAIRFQHLVTSTGVKVTHQATYAS